MKNKWISKVKWRTTTQWQPASQKRPKVSPKQVPSLGVFESKVSKMSYSESEPDFSTFAINSLSCKSESDDAESDFNSVFIFLDVCIFLTL